MTAGAEGISAPEHLTPAHDLTAFDSGIPALDDWLKRRALANEEAGGSRTYVVSAGGRVVGYYALATGGVVQEAATGRVRRNMPDPVPVMVLGRLAVYREAAEDHDRYRVRHVAPHSAGRRFLHHTAGRERIVTDDSAAGRDNIRAGSAGFLVGESPPLQPVIEGGDPGVERREVMRGCEVFRRAYPFRAGGHRSQGAFEASRRRSFGLSAGGLSSAAAKRLYAFSSSGKNRRSSSTASASRQAASSMKSDRFLPSVCAARSISARWRWLARRLIVTSRGWRSLTLVPGMVSSVVYLQRMYMT